MSNCVGHHRWNPGAERSLTTTPGRCHPAESEKKTLCRYTRKVGNAGMGEASDTWQTQQGETPVAEIACQGPSLTRQINENKRMHSTKYLLIIYNNCFGLCGCCWRWSCTIYILFPWLPLPGTACWGNAFEGGGESKKCRETVPKPKTKQIGFVMTYNFEFWAPPPTTEEAHNFEFGWGRNFQFRKTRGSQF